MKRLGGIALFVAACSRPAPDSTPDGAVRVWVEKMESSLEDPRASREAYDLLGPRARSNLKERADRASRGQGRRYAPHEMLAEGRFGLKFRPKSMTARISGNEATVDVRGDGSDDIAHVRCVREGSNGWRVEPDLPDPIAAPKRDGSSP